MPDPSFFSRREIAQWLAVLSTLLCIGGNAQIARPMADVRVDALSTFSSEPRSIATNGELIYFSADDGTHGAELWFSDGTAQGTRMVKDLRPGSRGSFPRQGAFVNGLYVFAAADAELGTELWVSDGTAAGTRLLNDIFPGELSSFPSPFFSYQNRLYFVARLSAENQSALWATDGTVDGTVLVKDFAGRGTGYFADYSPKRFAGGWVFNRYNAEDSVSLRQELWFTDGTTAGTRLIDALSSIYAFDVVDNALVIAGRRPSELDTIFVLDSLESPLQRVIEMSFVEKFFNVGDGLVFYGNNNEFGAAMWRTDGTEKGTAILQELRFGPAPAYPARFVALDKRGYWAMSDDSIWSTDGTVAGTGQVFAAAELPGEPDSFDNLIATPDALFFVAYTEKLGWELWRSSGTLQGTAVFNDPQADPDSSQSIPSFVRDGPGLRGVFNGELVFVSDDGIHGRELWLDDAAEGARLVADANVRTGSKPEQFAAAGDDVLFVGFSDTGRQALWRYDGELTQTYQIPQSVPSTLTNAVEFPRLGIALSGSEDVYFVEQVLDTRLTGGTDLWVQSEPDQAPEFLRRMLNQGTRTYEMARLPGGWVIGNGEDGISGSEIWRTDGTVAGTQALHEIRPGQFGSNANGFVSYNNAVYFGAEDGVLGRELWRTDGAAATLVADMRPGSQSSASVSFSRVDDYLFFLGPRNNAGTASYDLWRTDAVSNTTLALTAPISELQAVLGAPLSNGSFTLVSLSEPTRGWGLWRKDRLSDALTLVKDIDPAGEGENTDPFVLIDEQFYFAANDGVSGRELWTSDGTTNGTQLVRDINSGAAGSMSSELVAAGGLVFFEADDGTNGPELWTSDGSAAGTVMLQQIREGIEGGDLTQMTVVGDRLVFSADDGVIGLEPWVVERVSDLDRDGVSNRVDNCWLSTNTVQIDTDNDGIGNACDGDFNQDCRVNVLDLASMRLAFFSNDALHDLNADGVVNVADLARLRQLFFMPPGPGQRDGLCADTVF